MAKQQLISLKAVPFVTSPFTAYTSYTPDSRIGVVKLKYYQSFIPLLFITIMFSGCASSVIKQPEPLSDVFVLKRVAGGGGLLETSVGFPIEDK